MGWGNPFKGNPLRKIAKVGAAVFSPVTAPLAYLGGLQRGGFSEGANQFHAVASDPGDFWSNPQNRSMMAITAAQIAAIAGSAGAATPTFATGAGSGVLLPSSSIGALSAGAIAATGAAAGLAANRSIGSGAGAGDGTTPPDVNEANDPNTAQQFLRIRKAGRALGRSGTIKNKSSSTLGLGEQLLGDQLSLIGA